MPLVVLVGALAACSASASVDGSTDAGPPCPADPPASGAACTFDMSCHWRRCDAAGEVTATCAAGAWSVRTSECSDDCNGSACGAGRLCQLLEGGAQIYQCVDDPCDGAPLEACACSVCPDPSRCELRGSTVACANCFSDVCP